MKRNLLLHSFKLFLVGQDPVLSKSNLLRSFLLNAQQESSYTESYETNLGKIFRNQMNKLSIN